MLYIIVGILTNFYLAQGSSLQPVHEDVNPRIVEGSDAAQGQFPWQVSLQYKGQHYCGGSILAEKWIGTVAHCTYGFTKEELGVYCGNTDLKEGGSYFSVEQIIIHPSFKKQTLENDVSLIKLSKDLTFSHLINKISLPDADTAPDTPAQASGWGYDQTRSPRRPRIMQYINTTIISMDACKKAHKYTRPHGPYLSSAMHVCTLTNTEKVSYIPAICQGDSGGPLTIITNGSAVLAGMTSWNVPCGREGYPDVYTNCFQYRNWLLDNMK